MEPEPERPAADTFFVKVQRGVGGTLTGLVQHVRTGQKQPFEGLAGLGEAIALMSGRDGDDPTRREGVADG